MEIDTWRSQGLTTNGCGNPSPQGRFMDYALSLHWVCPCSKCRRACRWHGMLSHNLDSRFSVQLSGLGNSGKTYRKLAHFTTKYLNSPKRSLKTTLAWSKKPHESSHETYLGFPCGRKTAWNLLTKSVTYSWHFGAPQILPEKIVRLPSWPSRVPRSNAGRQSASLRPG